MTGPSEPSLTVRPAAPEDRAAVLELLSASLGWLPNEYFERFFAWKHEQNPFGASPGWVAVDGDRVVGFRTFLRWEYLGRGGRSYRAVRAVDTATHPEYQGRGIFRRLTMAALDDLRAEGVSFVFNTPNSQSRPGYLKMGWSEVGRLPASVRLRSPGAAVRVAQARVPADRASTPTDVGRSAIEALDDPSLPDLLASLPPESRLNTRRTDAFLRWRYGFPPLEYRALTVSNRAADGVALFRLRRRGPALECALCDVLVPGGDTAVERRLLRSVARESGADYVIRIGGPAAEVTGFVRLPGQGPVLTFRPVDDEPGAETPGGALEDWRLSLGDVELF
jgi:GNAT superfamily N-acetyltransferase